jgi:magnesium chelatase family protein
VGGGSLPRPGEISLAHHGVLFLDELPEFDRRALEALRQPFEEGRMTVARASRTIMFPARFILVAAMNPCPCGYRGHPRRACRCAPGQVERYVGRISGPFRDRIDLTVEVASLPDVRFTTGSDAEASSAIRERVLMARARQRERFQGCDTNATLAPRLLTACCRPDRAGLALLEMAADRLHLSARSVDKVLRVARTIADLAAAETIGRDHVAEAVQYRMAGW